MIAAQPQPRRKRGLRQSGKRLARCECCERSIPAREVKRLRMPGLCPDCGRDPFGTPFLSVKLSKVVLVTETSFAAYFGGIIRQQVLYGKGTALRNRKAWQLVLDAYIAAGFEVRSHVGTFPLAVRIRGARSHD